MNKTLIALAVAAGFPLAAAAQQTVTLYGIVDAGVTHANNGTASNFRVDSGVQSGSRWGLRGSENLGGGMTAVFNLENGFSADTGAQGQGALFGRTAWVGLKTGDLTVAFGRQYSPFYQALLNDPQGLGLWAPVSLITGYNYDRINNSVSLTYSGGGFTGRFLWGTGAENLASNTKKAGRLIGLGGEFKSGGLMVGAVYQEANDATNGSTKDKETLVHGLYNFGTFGINGGMAQVDPAGANNKVKSAWVGATVKVGANGTILAHIGQNDPEGPAKSRVLGVSYTHSLSKRSNLYVSAGQVSNNASANLRLSAAGATALTPTAGNDPRAISIGVRHNF